ncbi:hypothetical protein TR51_28460 [Kitasatospora griseola]|uniref:Uncharacterized protein n=2 Tax=Kitasatospora griseola TaxID=2064 RepID=A0A0D0NUI7_KITGR|nr:hypothetical protein TR51_28460 [Kitasatospora griseola]
MAVGAAGAGQYGVVLALVALVAVIVVCGTVVTLVLAVKRRDRLEAIRQLVPVLLRIADKITFWFGRRRK